MSDVDFTDFPMARTRRNHSFINQDLHTLSAYKRAEDCIGAFKSCYQESLTFIYRILFFYLGCNTSIWLQWKCHKPDQLVFQSSRKYDWRHIHPNWYARYLFSGIPKILLPCADAPTAGSCASTGLTYPPKPGSGGGTTSSTSTAPVSPVFLLTYYIAL